MGAAGGYGEYKKGAIEAGLGVLRRGSLNGVLRT